MTEITNIIEIVKDYLIISVLLICLCVGFILKNLVKTEKINPFIPLIMAVLGVALNLWFNAWAFSPTVLIGGLLTGLASSGAYDGYKAIKSFFGGFITNLLSIITKLKQLLNSNTTTDSANDTDELNE